MFVSTPLFSDRPSILRRPGSRQRSAERSQVHLRSELSGGFGGEFLEKGAAGVQRSNPFNGKGRFTTVDGSEIRRSPVEFGSPSHYLQGFLHPRWCRISEPSTVGGA